MLKIAFLSLARRANQGFHVVQILFQRPAARGGQPVFGLGHTPGKRFRAADIARVFQLAGVDAQVAVGHAEQLLELVEGERRVYGERADDGEPRALVDQAVQIRRRSRGWTRSRRALFAFFFPRGAEGCA